MILQDQGERKIYVEIKMNLYDHEGQTAHML